MSNEISERADVSVSAILTDAEILADDAILLWKEGRKSESVALQALLLGRLVSLVCLNQRNASDLRRINGITERLSGAIT